MDGYLFAPVDIKGIIEFKHLKKRKKCDLDTNQRPLKHEPVQKILFEVILKTVER